MNNEIAIYQNFCPNCWGNISNERLEKGLPCKTCLPVIPNKTLNLKDLVSLLPPGRLQKVLELETKLNQRIEYFKAISGKNPRTLQQLRTQRVLKKQSFSIIAPTGIWKTTRGVLTSSYITDQIKAWKAIIIVPTNLLVNQILNKFKLYGLEEWVLFYTTSLSTKTKEKTKKQIQDGDFKILIITSIFLSRNFEIVKKWAFDLRFLFVDDVDSVLKNWKIIEYIVKLAWFDDEDIQKVWRLLSLIKKSDPKSASLANKLYNYFQVKKEKSSVSVVTSSASARPKGRRLSLLKYLLGFEIWITKTNLRNVEDLYISQPSWDKIINNLQLLLKLIGFFENGILLFLPSDLSDRLLEIENFLNSQSIKAVPYNQLNTQVIQGFIHKEIKVLIGIASYKNPLARGLDIPQQAKYAIFWWVPKLIFKLGENLSPPAALGIIMSLNNILTQDLKKQLNRESFFIKSIKILKKQFEVSQDIQNFIQTILSNPKVKNLLKQSPQVSFDGQKFIIGDISWYIQASWRVSRLYPWGLTKWVAIMAIDNSKAFNSLQKKAALWYDIEFKPLDLSSL